MNARKLFTYLVLTCFVPLFFALDSGADVVVKGVKEPPSPPPQLTERELAWRKHRSQLRDLRTTLSNYYGVTIILKPGAKLADMPSGGTLKTWLSPEDLALHAELEFEGSRSGGDTMQLSATLSKGADGTDVTGDVDFSIKGYGAGTTGKWSSDNGLELEEARAEWRHLLSTLGARIDRLGEFSTDFALDFGLVEVRIDLKQLAKGQWEYHRDITLTRIEKAVEKIGEKMDEVGGVMIQFDPGLMALALTDQPPADVEKLGDASLVSLKRVLAARKAGEMTDLGEVTSVYGFMVDKINGDIILIGKAEPWAPRIGIDVLVAVLRSVWRDGLTPFVSIDPDPSDEMAPHRGRPGGVSAGLEKSSLLKIMFEADYLLKRFDSGDPEMDVPGVKSYYDLFVENVNREQPILVIEALEKVLSRVWLSPRQPAIGDIWELESEEGALYMFRSGVQVLTEVEQMIRVHRLVSFKDEKVSNKAEPLSEIACMGYTRHYDKLERRYSEFKQLRQVFELVQFAEIVRMKNIRYTILGELSRLPISPESHRDFYEVIGPRQVGDSDWEVSGGVRAELRLSKSKLRAVQELESTLKRLRSIAWRGPVVRIKDLFLPVVRETRVLNRVLIAEAFMEEALNELSDGNLQAALSKASKAVDADPESAEGYSLRAFIYDEIEEYQKAVKDLDNAIKYGLQDTVVYNNRGIAKEKLGDHEGAIEDISMALKINPLDATAYYNRGTPKYALGNYESAIADYTAALEINPAYAQAYNNRGAAKDASGDHEGAIEDISMALKINPRDAIAYYNRGAPKYALGDYEGAISDYTAVLKINPRLVKAYHNRGLAKNALGDHEGAIQDYTAALEIDPKDAETYNNRGIAKHELDDYEEAIQDYTAALAIDPCNARAYYNRGCSKGALGYYEAAIADFTAALEINTRDAEAYYNRALAKDDSGDLEGAIADCTAAIEINPRYAEAYSSRGSLKYGLADFDSAIEDCTAALKINPRYVEAYYIRAGARHILDDYKGAIEDWTAVLEFVPGNEDAYARRESAREELRDLEKAIQAYTEVIELNPQDATAYYKRGFLKSELAFCTSGDHKSAIEDYTAALKINPRYVEAYYGRGELNYLVDDYVGAIKDCTAVLKINPEHDEALDIRASAKYELADYKGAIEDCTARLKINPRNADAYYNRGSAKEALGDDEGALDDYEAYMEIEKAKELEKKENDRAGDDRRKED